MLHDDRVAKLEPVKAIERSRLETLVEREIFAEDGTRWRVREARVFGVPGAESDSCLICDSGLVCRRLWNYPGGWAELSTAKLFEVLERPR
jgi:hypothetical protein